MCGPGLGTLPAGLGIMMATAIVTSYVVAVLRGDVEAIFPYISDTGARIPESCIFGQFLNMAAFLAILTMYCRCKLVKTMIGYEESMLRTVRLAMVNAWFGVIASFGLMMVANFQEDRIESVHIIGACLVFGFGVIYEVIDTIITFRMCPGYNGSYVARVRLAIAVVSVISVVLSFVTAMISRTEWDQAKVDHSRLHWKPSDPGFGAHIASTVGEWVMALTFLLYFFTFIRDFQKMQVDITARISVQHLDEVSYVVETEPNERSKLIA